MIVAEEIAKLDRDIADLSASTSYEDVLCRQQLLARRAELLERTWPPRATVHPVRYPPVPTEQLERLPIAAQDCVVAGRRLDATLAGPVVLLSRVKRQREHRLQCMLRAAKVWGALGDAEDKGPRVG